MIFFSVCRSTLQLAVFAHMCTLQGNIIRFISWLRSHLLLCFVKHIYSEKNSETNFTRNSQYFIFQGLCIQLYEIN